MLKNINIKQSLLTRLLFIFFIAIFVQFFFTLTFNIFGYYFDLKKSIHNAVFTKLDIIKSDIERITSLGIPVSEIPQFNANLEKEKKEDYLSFIAVIDKNGTILYHSDPINIGFSFPITISNLEAVLEKNQNIYLFNNQVYLFKPIKNPSSVTEAFVIAAFSENYIYRKTLVVFGWMLFSSLFSLIFGVLLITFFYRKNIEQPLSILLQAVERVKNGFWEEINLKKNEPENELDNIAIAINKMIKELNKVFVEKETLLEKLKIEEEKLRHIIEKTEIGIVVTNFDKIIFANPGFFKIFHLPEEATVVSTSIFNFLAPFEIPFYRDVFKNVYETGERQFFEAVKFLDFNKNEIFCSMEISLISSSEWGSQLISLTLQDVTEKVKFTNELKNKNKEFEELIEKYQSSQLALQIANEKLETALLSVAKANEDLKKIDSIKDVFFSTITHELKTPISLIQGYISMLKNDPAIKTSSLSGDIILAIERASKRLLNLTEEIMELLRIRSGKMTLNLNLTYLSLIIKPIITEMEPLLDKKQLSIELSGIDNLPLINVDTKKMETVIRNILTNAIKFSRIGGKIYIVGNVLEEDGKKYVQISIKDEGCGISKNNLDKIFTEFFTMAPPSTVTKDINIKGSGLGLSIAKGIVEAHKGKIWAESEGYDEEKFPGTTFKILLPVNF